MKKILKVLSLFFLLSFLFFVTQAKATNNPGPVTGVTCGNTICLPTEICSLYEGETEQHCIPATINPTPNLPPDCDDYYKKTGQNTFPPNVKCWNHFTNTETDLSLYQKSCVYEPIVSYQEKRTLTGLQSFSQCGIGESGPNGPKAPGGKDESCDVHILVNTDVRDAEIGSYGPDASATAQYSKDFIAQNYLFNALFDRPSDLNKVDPELNVDGYSILNREAYRTYWRLMPASSQANLRSFVMNLADQKMIGDTHFDYIDTDGSKKNTSFTKLYDALKKQVILFWHFPFVRIGCLATYPVCPEYAQAQEELKPSFEDIAILVEQLELGPIVDGAITVYKTAVSAFGFDLNGPYAAFTPLDFDSVRGYIARKPDNIEQAIYDSHPELQDTVNGARYGTTRPSLGGISRESIPYIGAIYQGLLSPKFGMIAALQPQWIVDKYSTPGAEYISDYKMGNDPSNLPEVKIYKKGFFESLREELAGMVTDPLAWLTEKVASTFTNIFNPSDNKRIGYTDNLATTKEKKKEDPLSSTAKSDKLILSEASAPSCSVPVSYHLMSPKTVPISPDDHHQVVTIKGDELKWQYAPECTSLCKVIGGARVCSCLGDYIEGGKCCSRKWNVTGLKHGIPLAVLNNPKQTDIKNAVAASDQIALYSMLLPDGSGKIPEAQIDAPIASNTNTDGVGLSTSPGGEGLPANPAVSVYRENNLAQDSLHYLQNCWTVPKDLQNSPRCQNAIASSSACGAAPALTPIASCKVKNNTLKLPPTLIKAIETAAKTFSVPPSLIIAIIFGEGTFNPGSKYFNDAFITQNLPSCTTIPGCNPKGSVINNIVPFYSGSWDNLKDAVKVFDPTREPNACNLLDGIFALAKDLSQNQYGSKAFAGKSCFGIPLNAGKGSKGTCTWSDNNAETAIRVWEFGTAYNSTLSCATKINSCVMGGGTAAQCPRGEDLCETKDSRYTSQPSHNACVFDVYKSN